MTKENEASKTFRERHRDTVEKLKSIKILPIGAKKYRVQITKLFTLDISPEKFLSNCDPDELYETWLLISNTHYQNIISKVAVDVEIVKGEGYIIKE